MCYPSLVFRAELPRTGNARHAKHNCGQPENSAVIVDVLIGGAFGATVGRVEIQRLRFAHASLIGASVRSEEHTSELQSHSDLVCRLLLEKKKNKKTNKKHKQTCT